MGLINKKAILIIPENTFYEKDFKKDEVLAVL